MKYFYRYAYFGTEFAIKMMAKPNDIDEWLCELADIRNIDEEDINEIKFRF